VHTVHHVRFAADLSGAGGHTVTVELRDDHLESDTARQREATP
jgi:hypothetical protein